VKKAFENFKLIRNPAGQLQLTTLNNEVHNGVYPVRAFPISAADEGLSLMGREGHELAWINQLSDLPKDIRALIAEELTQRDFMPEIQRIMYVSSFATPSTWQLMTNRGEATLTLKSEDHIRRLTQSSLLISDSHGIDFLIKEIDQLDKPSRKLLDRFL
jgi:hypothetical protein